MIIKSVGDEIDWNEGMNVTVKKCKSKKNKKKVMKKQPSFFEFFNLIDNEDGEGDEELIKEL